MSVEAVEDIVKGAGSQVYVGIGKALSSCLNKLVHELIIFFAPHAVLTETQVKLVIEQIFVLWRG